MNYLVKIKQLEAELVNLWGEFERAIKMLEDGKAHFDMLEAVIRKEQTQIQQVKDGFKSYLY